MATFAAVLGESLPEKAGQDSHNILPALFREKRDQPIRDMVILQSTGGSRLAIRQGPWKLIPWRGSGGFLTEPRIIKPKPGEAVGQLYHLHRDPSEQHNLYQQHPQIVQRLAKLLEQAKRQERSR